MTIDHQNTTPAPTGEGLDAYDAGLLSDYGGGDVGWWQDYLRAELARAHDHYAAQHEALLDALTSARERATAWSSALETACTILGVGCGLGAFEAVEAIRRHDAATLARATAAEALLREAGEVVEELLTHSVAHYGRPKDEEWGVGLYHARARALSAKLEGRGDG